jgi:hypothetical protein
MIEKNSLKKNTEYDGATAATPPKRTPTKFDMIKMVAKEACLNSTSHGIPNIVRSQMFFLKVLWFIMLVASSGGCLYLVLKAIASYLDYDVVTKISVNAEIPALFPVITICNMNPISNEKALKYSKNILNENNITSDDLYIVYYGYLRYYVPMTANHPNQTDETRKLLGSPLQEMILSCSFNLKDCIEDWQWHYNSYYGKIMII